MMTDLEQKAAKDRSPSFPFISLKVAVVRLSELEAKFTRHPIPADKAGLAWGMKEKSSQAAQTLAAIKSFGLVEYQGSGGDRVATISDDGRTYLRAQQDSVKQDVLKRVALKPKEIEKYWRLWGVTRPPKEVCLDQLVLKGGYTQSAAETFLQVYDATIEYGRLSDSEVSATEDESASQSIEIGDLVQATINGADIFEKPKRVRRIASNSGKKWVFVEGSETGVPIEQVSVWKKRSVADPGIPTLNIYDDVKDTVMRKEVFALDEGDVTLTFPDDLSVDSYNDLEGYLKLFLSKAKRRAEKDRAEKFKTIERDIEGDD